MKFIFLICLLCFTLLNAVSVYIVDNNNQPIPHVVIRTNDFTTVTDSLGYKQLPNLKDNDILVFNRLGFKEASKKYSELKKQGKVSLSFAPVESEAYIIKSQGEESSFRISSSTQKINIQELQKNYSSVNDIIQDIPEIDLRGIRLAGERQTVSIGGHQSRHTVIMWDNVILNPSGQAVDLSAIPASQIESIEIVKNNVSVETGSGGIAGIIIINSLKTQKSFDFGWSQSIGSYNTVKQNIYIQGSERNFDYSFGTSFINADNDFKYIYRDKTEKRTHNSKHILNLNSHLQYRLYSSTMLYNFKYQKFFKQLPGPVNYSSLYERASQTGENENHILLLTNKNPYLNLESQIYHIKLKSLYDNTQAPVRIFHAKDENIQYSTGLKTIGFKTLSLEHYNLKLSLGNEIKSESFKYNDLLHNLTSIDKIRHTTRSYFSSINLSKDFYDFDTDLTFSGRYDSNSHLKNYRSWRIETNNNLYSYLPLNLKANIGTSYMIPSFYDLYWKGDSQTNGNPDLKPEESFGWRTEISTLTNPAIGFAKWNNKTKNLIYWFRSLQGWKPGNVQDAEIDNIEVFASYNFLKNQSLNINYSKTEAKDISKNSDFYGKNIIYTPKWKCNVSLNLNYLNFRQTINYISQGKQWSTRDQLIPALKGYEIYNSSSSISYKLGKINTNLVFSLYNIFDKNYQNFPYIPEPGRNWDVQINFKLF